MAPPPTSAATPAEVFYDAGRVLRCKECETEYELEARYVCERCFGPLEVAYDAPRVVDVDGAAPPDPGRPAEHLALRGLPAAAAPPGPSAR